MPINFNIKIVKNTLKIIRIVISKTRQLSQLTPVLEKKQATLIQCPLIAILDNPNTAPIEAWLQKFIALSSTFIYHYGR
jgi:hypothetical protein